MKMINKLKISRVARMTATAAATLTAAAGVVAMQPAAHANAVDLQSVCGSNYVLRHSAFPIQYRYRDVDGVHLKRVGAMWILKNRSSDTHCLVVTRASGSGYMVARIGHYGSSGWSHTDSGNFSSYAGPVDLSRNGGTLKFYGQVSGYTLYVKCGASSCSRYAGTSA